jgi:stress response protein YsnF
VPIGREVAQAPLPFEEGDTLIIPVVEERLIVEKRLVVVEEIRVAAGRSAPRPKFRSPAG